MDNMKNLRECFVIILYGKRKLSHIEFIHHLRHSWPTVKCIANRHGMFLHIQNTYSLQVKSRFKNYININYAIWYCVVLRVQFKVGTEKLFKHFKLILSYCKKRV